MGHHFKILLAIVFLVLSCRDGGVGTIVEEPEAAAFSMSGIPLFPLQQSNKTSRIRDSLLVVAENDYNSDPKALENIIWYGRRLAYKDRYNEAIAVFTLGMESHPEAPELFRHRGHRFITTRNLDNGIEDLLTAAKLCEGREIEIEKDGLPNKLNIPLSNLQFNIYYHLGLAYFLKGEFNLAEKAYLKCMEFSDNPDLEVATADWLFMTYLRLGKNEEAKHLLDKIPDDLELIENEGYYKRIKMYKGIISPDELLNLKGEMDNMLQLVTQGYGVAHHYKMTGNEVAYLDILNKIINTGYWPAFGYIAAEADLYNLNKE